MEKRGDIVKIIIVLGTSGSGKTTYIENEIIKGRKLEDSNVAGIPTSITEDLLLFGKYNVEKRCKGCDTLSMAIIDDLLKAVEILIEDKLFKTIVMDGDRVNNIKMFEFLCKYKSFVEIIFIDTALEVIYQRLPECNKQFVQTTETKTRNSIYRYAQMGFNIVKITHRPKGKWF